MVRNLTRETVVAARPRLADTCWWRMRGMIGRRFEGFDGLVFSPCGSIHTWFMGIALDVIFADRHGRIRGLRRGLRPWRLAISPGSRIVVELPAGALDRSGCQPGDQLAFTGPVALDVLPPRQ